MSTDGLDKQADTRSVPLPEERRNERDGEDRHAEADEILRDSEDRVNAAAEAETPEDAAVEHRRSEDTSTG